MENQLWDLFRETGDPLSYLLYKAGEKQKQESKKETLEQAGETNTPPVKF